MSKISYTKISDNKYLQKIQYYNEFSISPNQINNLCDLDELYKNIFGNEVNVCDLTQQNVFKKLIDLENATSVPEVNIKNNYLDITKELLYRIDSVSLESIFFTYSTSDQQNIQLLNNLDFSGLFDLRNAINEIKQEFVDNSCILKSDYDPSESLHPYKLLIVKLAVKLIIRLHILDFKTKNLFNSSVFNHEEFIKTDDSLLNYLYYSFLSKLTLDDSSRRVQTYYFNFIEACVRLLNDDLENNLCLTNPITKKRLKFSKINYNYELNDEVETYIKFLFSVELVKETKLFNTFFSRSVSLNNSTRVSLGKNYNLLDYVLTNIPLLTGFGSYSSEYKNLYYSIDSKNNNTFIISLNSIVGKIASVNIQASSDVESTSNIDIFNINFNNILQSLKDNLNIKLFFNYIFNLNKILNISSIFQFHLISNETQEINDMYLNTFNELKNIIKLNLVNRNYDQYDQELECPIDLDFELNGLDINSQINLELAKLIATTPIKIFKGLVETTDPNISVATKIRAIAESAGADKLPIIPYSLGLLPAGLIPPPIGIGPPILPPYGYMYWAIDAAEVAYAYSNDKNINNRNETSITVDDSQLDSLSDLLPEECK